MTPQDHVGDDPVPHAGGGSQGLSTARLTGLLNGTYAKKSIGYLEGVKTWVFGDSYGKNTNQGADTGTLWVDRLSWRHKTQAPLNYAVAGTRSDQILAAIQANFPANGRGLVLLADCVINDERQYGDTTGTPTTAEAFRSILTYLTSWAVNSYSSSAFVFGPNWASGSSSTTGSYFDFSFTGNTAYLLVNYVTGSGGTLTVKNTSGTTLATVTTGGYKQNFTGAVKLTGLGSGSRTLRVALTSGSAAVVGIAIPGTNAPTVLWQQPGQFSASSSEYTRLQAYLAACAPVLADYPTASTFTVDAGWDYTTMAAADGVHPNERGVAYITDLAEAALRSSVTGYREGLHWLTATSATASNGTYTPPTVNYVGSGATAPAQIATFTASAGYQVSFAWTAPTDGGATVTSYIIQSSPAGANTWTTLATPTGSAMSYTATSGLTASTSYDFRIAAVNSVGTGTYSATSTATAGATPYAFDDFTRSDGALGSTPVGAYAWQTTNASVWAIASGKVSCTTGGTTPYAASADCYIDTGQADGTITVTQTTANSSTTQIGISFRMSGSNHPTGYVFWKNSSGVYTLSKRSVGTTYTSLGTGGSTAASGDVMAVVLSGSSIICKVNGATVITVTDATYTGTQHGLFAVNSTPAQAWDNFAHTA